MTIELNYIMTHKEAKKFFNVKKFDVKSKLKMEKQISKLFKKQFFCNKMIEEYRTCSDVIYLHLSFGYLGACKPSNKKTKP